MFKKLLLIFIIAHNLLAFSSSFSMDVKYGAEIKTTAEINPDVKAVMEDIIAQVEKPSLAPSLQDHCIEQLTEHLQAQFKTLTGRNVDAIYNNFFTPLPDDLKHRLSNWLIEYYQLNYPRAQEVNNNSGEKNSNIRAICYHPNGNELAVGDGDGQSLFICQRNHLNLLTFKQALHKGGHTIDCIAYHPNGNEIATASNHRTICIWQRNFNNNEFSFKEKLQPYIPNTSYSDHTCLAYSPDGNELAIGFMRDFAAFRHEDHQDASICILQRNAQGAFTTSKCYLTTHTESIFCLAYSPDGNEITTGSFDGTICTLRRNPDKTFTCQRQLTVHCSPVYCLAYSPDGNELITGSYSWCSNLCLGCSSGSSAPCLINVWQRNNKGFFTFKQQLHHHYIAKSNVYGSCISSIAYHPNGNEFVASAGVRNNTISIWQRNLAGKYIIKQTLKKPNEFCVLTYCPIGHEIAAVMGERFFIYDCIRLQIEDYIENLNQQHAELDKASDDQRKALQEDYNNHLHHVVMSILTSTALKNSQTMQDLQILKSSDAVAQLPNELARIIESAIDGKIKLLSHDAKEQKEFKEEKEGKESDKEKKKENNQDNVVQQLSLNSEAASAAEAIAPPSPRASQEN